MDFYDLYSIIEDSQYLVIYNVEVYEKEPVLTLLFEGKCELLTYDEIMKYKFCKICKLEVWNDYLYDNAALVVYFNRFGGFE